MKQFRCVAPSVVAAMVLASAIAPGQDRPARDGDGKLPDVAGRRSGAMKATRTRDAADGKFRLATPPESVRVRIGGRVLDLKGEPIRGATVYLVSYQTTRRPRPEMKLHVAATATSRADGFYSFHQAKIPTSDPLDDEFAATPYVQFQVMARADGFGLGWHGPESMYAVDPPHPNDIQGRAPLDSPLVFDVQLRPAADLTGRAVDEKGRPVAGVKIRCLDVDLLDEDGAETTVRTNLDADHVRIPVGAAETGADGRFRMPGLPAESCCWLQFQPKGANAERWLYAGTSAKAKIRHPQPPPERHNGRGEHEVYPAEMTVVLPTTRRLEITVVGDDDGKPAPGIYVNVLGESLATGIAAGGQSDAVGRVALNLPVGEYRGIVGDPPSAESRFIRTYTRPPLRVAEEPATQPLEFRMTPGAEVRVEVVDSDTGKGLAGCTLQIRREGAAEWEPLARSPSSTGGEPTDASGRFRAILAPARGQSFRVRALASGTRADADDAPQSEAVSEPFEAIAGKAVMLRLAIKPGAAR